MDYSQLKFDVDNSPAIKSLRSPHAPLIFSFLYQQFKQQQRITAPYQDLVESLDAVLDEMNEQQPDSFTRNAKHYLDNWSKELRLLRIFSGKHEEWLVEMTPDAERVIRWLEELRQRPFVGTESRFRSIFLTLNEIATNSTTDPEQRLEYLRGQQATLQREIDEIVETGQVRRLNETQIRERYLQTNENALRLLGDFASVEQNFRDLAHEIQKAALQPDVQKGTVIGEMLDANEALENSDEGRSFRAFWQFLLSPTQKDEFTRLLAVTQQLPELNDVRQNSILPGLTGRLLDAGHKVIESNQQLAEQLRRMLDERLIAESQRVRELCAQIKQLAFEHVQHPPAAEGFLVLEVEPQPHLFMDRPLWSPAEATQFDLPLAATSETPLDLAALESLYNQYYVDDVLLESRLSVLLDAHPSVTLTDVLTQYPATKGIGEILAYLRLAAENPRHIINPEQTEIIEIDLYQSEARAKLRIPQTTYQRRSV